MKTAFGFFTGWLLAVWCGFALLSLVDPSIALAENSKVGIINTAKILMKSNYALKIKDEFMAEIAEQRDVLDRRRTVVEKLRQKLDAAKAAGKRDSTIEKLEDEYLRAVREFNWMKEDFDKEIREMDKALLEKMKKRIRSVLDHFITVTDFCIILDKQSVAVYCDSVDVTDDIIRRLDTYRD